MKKETKEISYLTYKDVVELNVIFNKIVLDGIKDSAVCPLLQLIGDVAEQQASYIKRIEAIDAKRPIVLSNYIDNRDADYTNDELAEINKAATNWNIVRSKTIEEILATYSTINSASCKLLSKDDILKLVKVNKDIRFSEWGIVYKLLTK